MTDAETLDALAEIISTARSHPRLAVGQVLNLVLVQRMTSLTRQLLQTCGLVVQSGPFAGMHYVSQSSAGSFFLPKLLGCYEAELHDLLNSITRKAYRAVVNIGSGEGYYAVGLARLLPSAQVYAFDSDPVARQLCRQMAQVNGVADRVVVAGACGHSQLRDLAGENTLIVCDCEGGELQLLNPQEAPGLAASDLLVEMHDFLEPQTSRLLPSRFGQTHEVAIIPHSGRNPYSLSVLREMNQLDQWLAVWEGRPAPTPWAWMIPQGDSDLRLTPSG